MPVSDHPRPDTPNGIALYALAGRYPAGATCLCGWHLALETDSHTWALAVTEHAAGHADRRTFAEIADGRHARL